MSRISVDGLHQTAEQCRAAWDRETSSDQKLETMIALADEWLKLCTRSRSVNRRLRSSFGLSKICSRWHDGKRVLNGPFLMACHRAGYEMEVQPPKFVAKIGRDDANAWISIAA